MGGKVVFTSARSGTADKASVAIDGSKIKAVNNRYDEVVEAGRAPLRSVITQPRPKPEGEPNLL
jgi:hypothetical protein